MSFCEVSTHLMCISWQQLPPPSPTLTPTISSELLEQSVLWPGGALHFP